MVPSGKFLIAALLVSIVLAYSSGMSQGIELKFNPPDGVTFYQNIKQTKISESGSDKRTDVTESRTQIHIAKSDSGYVYTMTPEYVKMTRNGQPIDNPAFTLLTKLQPVFYVDNAGQIVAIQGYDKVVGVVEESIPVELRPQMSAIFNEETLIAKEIAEWNGRIGDYVGAVVDVGDIFYSEVEVPLPVVGSAVYYSVVKIAGETECGDDECLRLEFSYNSNPEGFKEFMEDFFDDFMALIDSSGLGVAVSDVEISGQGERLIIPSNMLIVSENTRRAIKMRIEGPGGELTSVTLYEEQVHTYEY